MYVRTHEAAVWVDGPADAARRHTPRPKRVQRRATRPLQTHAGVAHALRFEGEDPYVLVNAVGRYRWVPLAHAMDEAEAKRWIRTSFPRGG